MKGAPWRSPALLAVVAAAALAGCPAEKPPPPETGTPTSKRPATPPPAKPEPEVPADTAGGVEAALEAHLRAWALRDPDDTWALAHGLHALGPETRLPDGRLLVDALLATASVQTVAGKTFPAFEGKTARGTPREPHRNLVIRALLNSGVDLEHAFEAGGKAWTVRDLYEGALWRFTPPVDAEWGMEAWTLAAIRMAVARGEGNGTFAAQGGGRQDARELARRAGDQLLAELVFLEEFQKSGRPLVKRRQHIYAEPCGGYHFVEAVALWGTDEETSKTLEPKLQRVQALLSYRLRAEASLYDETRKKAPPQYLRLLWIQDLKFFGHWLETAGRLRDAGVAIDPADVSFARERLEQAHRQLTARGAFSGMEAVRQQRPQSYLDLIGDAAHALVGLRAWPQGR